MFNMSSVLCWSCLIYSYTAYVLEYCIVVCFFFQAEDGIRDLVRSRGLGDVYKRQRQADQVGRRVSVLKNTAIHTAKRDEHG